MIEAGHALAVLGNHELNALAYHTEDRDAPVEYLRRRSPKDIVKRVGDIVEGSIRCSFPTR